MMMSVQRLVAQACLRLRGVSTLSSDELRLTSYSDDTPAIDACAGIQ
jgi:hypothetical protein